MPRGKTYVDNSQNRSLGRVGASMGSMPVSASRSSSSSYTSSGSQSSYVDNSVNRSVGRVGMPMGSMPVSASRSSSSSYTSSGSQGSYVDNSFNRSVGRVGMPMGSMPVSKSSSLGASSASSTDSSTDSPKVYVDNALNRRLGRVGEELGTKPHSRSQASASNEKVYVDNALNRSLGRVGEELGTKPHSRSQASASNEKVYVDNDQNRKLGRVGLKLGAMPVSRTKSKNSGKQTQPTHLLNEMYNQLLMGIEADDLPDDQREYLPADVSGKVLDNMCDTVFSLIRRMNQVLKWKESNQDEQPRTVLKTFKYDGPVVKFEEIKILKKKIGQGGFGDVHFGEYKDTVVAVKKLRVQRVSQRRLRQFQEEVEILYRLDHPHIVRFIGASIVTPNLAILLEYMQKSLYEALHVEEQDYTPEEQHQILLHTADGLAYLHENSVAHCDIKSTNILLDSTNGDIIVAKISDFGLSMMKSETETSQSTAKVQGVGTPKYSAPEVLEGDELGLPAMCKADVYSMSVVAWEVICQEEPFSGLNIHQLKRRVCSGDVNLKFPEDVKVGDDLKDLLKECWSRDANKRPSAQAFKDCLAKLESII